MLKGKNIDFSYSKDKTFIKNLNIDIPKGGSSQRQRAGRRRTDRW